MASTLQFGECILDLGERRLECRGQPVKVGGRALDLLAALALRKGEVVTARELMEYAWPHAIVTDSSLRTHLGELRKALSAASPNCDRLILNIPGRGYQLAVPAVPAVRADTPAGQATADTRVSNSIQPPRIRVFGRASVTQDVLDLLAAHPIVTLVGPGGMGKTTVAGVILEGRQAAGAQTIWVDLSHLDSDGLVVGEVARAAGLVQRGDTVGILIETLRSRGDLLMVLDCCERVVAGAATLAETLTRQIPSLRIVATSREPLHVEGERAVRLPPLAVAPVDDADPGEWGPAIDLFIARAHAVDAAPQLPRDIPSIKRICQGLDGIPLAIELAAAHLAGFGLDDLASLISSGFQLGNLGRRTASERHKTLEATFEWSYGLLDDIERQTLEWLAVFEGGASLKGILDVLSATEQTPTQVAHNLARLVDKSLVKLSSHDGGSFYRLLDTTRTFAARHLQARGEVLAARFSHAQHMLRAVSATQIERSVSAVDWFGSHFPNLSNLRAALTWTRSEPSAHALSVALAAASAPTLLQLSLHDECERCCSQALALLPASDRAHHNAATRLLGYQGGSMLATSGPVDECLNVMNAALAQAKSTNDLQTQALVLSGLFWFWIYRGEPNAAARAANEMHKVAEVDTASTLMRDGMLTYASTFAGDQRDALARLLDIQQRNVWLRPGQFMRVGSEPNIFYGVFTIKTRWLRGEVDQARALYAQLLASLQKPEHGLYYCWALNEVMVPMHCFLGDWHAARATASELEGAAMRQSMAIRKQAATCASMAIDLCQGLGELDAFMGAVEVLRKSHFASLLPWLDCVAAQQAAARGRASVGLGLMDRSISQCERTGARSWLPEIHRVRGLCLLASASATDKEQAIQQFRLACEVASTQTAAAFQLSAAVDWAEAAPGGIDEEVRAHLEQSLSRAPEMSKQQLGMRARRLLNLDLAA